MADQGTLATAVLEMRLTHRLTREQLAERLNVSPTTIYRWETGRRMVTMDVLQRVAGALNYTKVVLAVR